MNASSPADRSSPGDTIRALRKNGRMTLNDMSSRTGLAVSTLCKLENGRTGLSYDKLLRISQGLGVDMAQLLDARTPPADAGPGHSRRVVQRAGEGVRVETSGHRALHLATELLSKRFAPRIDEIRTHTLQDFFAQSGDWLHGPGEEFVYVLEGEIELHTEFYAPVRLKAGDSSYFDGEMGHACLKACDGTCRALVVCSPRTG